jgi:hypothetical protein
MKDGSIYITISMTIGDCHPMLLSWTPYDVVVALACICYNCEHKYLAWCIDNCGSCSTSSQKNSFFHFQRHHSIATISMALCCRCCLKAEINEIIIIQNTASHSFYNVPHSTSSHTIVALRFPNNKFHSF